MKILALILAFLAGVFISAGVVLLSVDTDSNENLESSRPQEVADDDQINSVASNVIEFTSKYRGAGDRNKYSQKLDEPVSFIVNSQERLSLIWPELFRGSLSPPMPSINFSSQSLLITMLDQKPTDGYLATIQNIERDGDTLRILLQEKAPGNGCPTKTETTRPNHIVAISKTDAFETELKIESVFGAPCKIDLTT